VTACFVGEGERREKVKADLELLRPYKVFPPFLNCLSHATSSHPLRLALRKEMDNDQNSADAGADNAMARQDIPETVQPRASFILYDLEITNRDLPGSIQIAIPKLPSTDSVDPTSSYRENDDSERPHPSPSTNATDLKRKRTGDGAARAPKKSRASERSSSPAFPMGRLADLRGTPVPIEPETPPVDNREFLKWVHKQTKGYAPHEDERMLFLIRFIENPDTLSMTFAIALGILRSHMARLVKDAEDAKTLYANVQMSGGPCVKSVSQTLEQATDQLEKRRDDFAERLRAFEAEDEAEGQRPIEMWYD